ncbi:MAG: hypothetical protein ACI3YC_04390 [Alloprevotella sp.]
MFRISLFRLTVLACVLLAALSSFSQPTAADSLFARFKAASGFDRRYPREAVYVHFDNTSYVENDTVHYKAYVVRASSLRPTTLSRVLYVELLNADGQLVERQVLPVDSLGQADGAFSLTFPVRSGYYEVRAYTRAMTNWGAAACFSRVLPVFAARNPMKTNGVDARQGVENLSIPQPTPHDKVTFAKPRPYLLSDKKQFRLRFYPEGGARVRDAEQQVAFELTDGRGRGCDETIRIFDENGDVIAEVQPESQGRGSFLLPSGAGKAYALVGTEEDKTQKRFPLPKATEDYALRVIPEADGIEITVSAAPEAAQRAELLGLAILHRERVTYFDTVTVGTEPVCFFLEKKNLRGGVNRLVLFDAKGRSHASRLFWSAPTAAEERTLNVEVKQNEAVYDAFQPAVLTFDVTDAAGNPVETTFSVAVREKDANITASHDGGLCADLLLSSELKGYIHRPDLYFEKDDAAHRRMLDLLLMVQGWSANTFDVMCEADTFRLLQPIEEKLILRGTVYKDNDRFEPRPGFSLSMKAYSQNGAAIEGEAVTDDKGEFAFESQVNYWGDYLAQFTMRNEDGKKRWSRLALDRWFAPQPEPFRGPELDFDLTIDHDSTLIARELLATPTFEWKDTIPMRRITDLKGAEVKVKRKYYGFTGNRYTYDGGEKTGMRRATHYYNLRQETDRYKDMGYQPGELFSFLSKLEQDAAVDYYMLNENGYETGNLSAEFNLRGREMEIFINNTAYDSLLSRFPELYTDLQAEEFVSCYVVEEGLAEDAVTGKQVNRSKARYRMYLYQDPEAFRVRSQRGVERRMIQGFTEPMKCYEPDYRAFDAPNEKDFRRTLKWAPSVKSDAKGKASLVFYTNARPGQRLDISVRGVTADGRLLDVQ